MRAFRVGSAKHAGTKVSAFSGQGSLYGDGRWHHRGRLIVYTASHRSLALLEILVHLDRKNQIQPLVGWEIEVPAKFITAARALPVHWHTDIEVSRRFGDAWLASRNSVALTVPSVIVKEELNLLINPAHPAFDVDWVLTGPHPVAIDPRLI